VIRVMMMVMRMHRLEVSGVGGAIGHYWVSPLLEFVAPCVETGGLAVPGVISVGSGLVSVALPPAVGTRSGCS
jgi:hypothetical protein